MSDKNLNFEIVPIFNQTGPVWNEFARIESACDKVLGYSVNKDDTNRMIKNYMRDWYENKYNFAFGAYYNQTMIGFTKGFMGDEFHEVYLSNLYVLPKYQKKGVGTKLLKTAERASSIVADRISLIPLIGACGFYEIKNGYENRYGDQIKDLSPFVSGIMPVFQWIKRDFNVAFNIKADGKLLRHNKHQPIFMYLNDYGAVDGVALQTKTGENKIWTDINRCRHMLLNALQKIK